MKKKNQIVFLTICLSIVLIPTLVVGCIFLIKELNYNKNKAEIREGLYLFEEPIIIDDDIEIDKFYIKLSKVSKEEYEERLNNYIDNVLHFSNRMRNSYFDVEVYIKLAGDNKFIKCEVKGTANTMTDCCNIRIGVDDSTIKGEINLHLMFEYEKKETSGLVLSVIKTEQVSWDFIIADNHFENSSLLNKNFIYVGEYD